MPDPATIIFAYIASSDKYFILICLKQHGNTNMQSKHSQTIRNISIYGK